MGGERSSGSGPSENEGAAPWVPSRPTVPALKAAVQECRGCELYRDATQAVMGDGPAGARLMLLGEQPGDREDREGLPFVGPAGRLLDDALAAAGLADVPADRFAVTRPPQWLLATTHPSAVLRSRQRDTDFAALVADLAVVRQLLA